MIKIFTIFIACILSIFSTASTAQVNLGFTSSGLSGWTLSARGSQNPSGYNSNGVGASVVSNMSNFHDGNYTWNINPYSGNYMASLQPGSSSPSYSSMTTAFGLNASSINSIQSFLNTNSGGGATNPTNASYMYYSGLNLTAGTNFTVAWNFVATDYTPWNDTSITTLVATSGGGLATINNITGQYSILGAINPGAGNYSTNSYGSTGWEVATYHVNTTGTYTLGFGSFNLGDTVNSPILLVSGAQGTTYNGTTPVNPIQPNQGSSAPPPPTGPTVVSTSTTNQTTTSTSYGNPSTSISYTTRTVYTTDNAGNQIVQTFTDTVTTTTTPIYTTTTVTPVTTTTWSDGSTTTSYGTPTTTTNTTYQSSSSTTLATTPTSTAPWICCGGSSSQFNADSINTLKVQTFTGRLTSDSQVYIQQVGDGNIITVDQEGTKNNYAYISNSGSNNNISITQKGNTNTTTNYSYTVVNGISNNISVTQSSTGGGKGSFINVQNNSNTVNVTQTDSGSHYAEVGVSGGNKSVDITQSGSASQMASVQLSGNPTSLTLQQTGSTQNFYSIQFNCATAGGCPHIQVSQGH